MRKLLKRNKVKVGLIYGGPSCEHEVSKMTAKSILENIDRRLYKVTEIYVNKKGDFDHQKLSNIDVAFLAWHGPNCEDGKFQKFLETQKIKYTGSGPKSSQINFDKDLQKKYFKKAGLRTADYFVVPQKISLELIDKTIKNSFDYPCFVKAANTGSTIGITKVNSKNGLKKALQTAKKINRKIIIEQAIISPREIEIGALGNKNLTISNPGEVLTKGKVYSYRAKYFKPFATTTNPKNLSQNLVNRIKDWAKIAYKVTDCRGFARVDFFLNLNGKLYINEINTIPGFTKTSMYPKLMAKIGIKYKDLITKIINLALE